MKIKILLFIVTIFSFLTSFIYAEGEIVVEEEDVVEGFGSFRIPTFLDIGDIRNFSIYSWVALALQLAIIGFALYLIVKLIIAGVNIMRGEDKDMAQAKRKFTAVFTALAILFLFVAIVTIIASYLGVGSFTQWPRFLSQCDLRGDDGQRRYYFSVYAENAKFVNAEEVTNDKCFQESQDNNTNVTPQCPKGLSWNPFEKDCLEG